MPREPTTPKCWSGSTPKTPEEIKAWSDEMMKVTLMNDPAKKEYFSTECKALGLDPEKTTLFQWLAADDKASLKK